MNPENPMEHHLSLPSPVLNRDQQVQMNHPRQAANDVLLDQM